MNTRKNKIVIAGVLTTVQRRIECQTKSDAIVNWAISEGIFVEIREIKDTLGPKQSVFDISYDVERNSLWQTPRRNEEEKFVNFIRQFVKKKIVCV